MLTVSRRIKMTNALGRLTEPLATDLCTSKQTLLTLPLAYLGVTFLQALLFRVFQKVSQGHPKVFKEMKVFQKDRFKRKRNIS